MKILFAPGILVMHRLGNNRKLPLLSLLFLVPLAILYYQTWAQLPALTHWLVGGTLALALYGMASFYLQANAGWDLLVGVIKRVAEGDLTAKINTRLGGHFGTVMRA